MASNRNGHGNGASAGGRSKGKAVSPVAKTVRAGADAVKQVSMTLAQRAAETAADLGQRARERSGEFLVTQKSAAAKNLGQVGEVVRQAAERLQEDQGDAVARYVRTAADRLDGAAQYLSETELSELARGASGFAQRQPALFLGAMFLAGLAVGRFAKTGVADTDARGSARGESSKSRGRNRRDD